jgi:hypothetical protein
MTETVSAPAALRDLDLPVLRACDHAHARRRSPASLQRGNAARWLWLRLSARVMPTNLLGALAPLHVRRAVPVPLGV